MSISSSEVVIVYIESAHNDRVRAWARLKTRRGRERMGLFLVEGERLVAELLHSPLRLEALLWNVASDEPPGPLWRHPKADGRRYELSPQAFAAVADTETPQGVMAVAAIPQAEPRYGPRVLVLDAIQDPGNVGTLVRSAEAFGFGEIVFGTGTVDPYAPKVVRASMGGLFRVNAVAGDAKAYLRAWRDRHPDGVVVATAADARERCDEAPMAGEVAVVIGNEARGVSDAVRQWAQRCVAIPMAGKAESLNAAMAGTILLYEAYRQASNGAI
ncbi:tRNA/rRNA methyltransferase (SpoU) [Alicyclobacillus acidocaldarius subsp. acidocaldarius Tc-4-1]|uniref:tRNA/rRNA methyltransferase (SpoU) n=1 Tax=Alicyclobacillus acidocaldarius (strain Tc-4-1) TaxID=1048834 RepID=F8IG41_ALIAT|nr:tRNA/rRNA methyltransferase (SpoU) [Alicyclobacillus acidocaldarius subsp. acidocaldarius Tc-4-1]